MSEIIQEDLEELEEIMEEAAYEKDPNLYLQVAIKAKDIADLFHEADDGQSYRFVEYKIISGNHYMKVAKKMGFPQAYLMAIIVFLQANDKKKARKALKKLNRKKSNPEIDPIVTEIAIEILNENFSHTLDNYKSGKYDIDENIAPDIEKLFKYREEKSIIKK